jgi:hypothetical protein
MTDDDLLALDKCGFIPGRGESEEDFLARVAETKKNFQAGSWLPESHWNWVRELLSELFDVKPLYICAFYSNRNLTPWQGAASWIRGRTLDSIQLRSALKKGSYLGLYSRDEILAHEAAHAARAGFDEARFEEYFAYMSSTKKWRRVLGPIIRRPWEIWPFFLLCMGGVFFKECYFGALFWMLLGFIRLIKGHAVLRRAADQILKEVQDPKKVRAILFRLTDQEILQFAKGVNIQEYASIQTCLRWRVLRSYLYCGGV